LKNYAYMLGETGDTGKAGEYRRKSENVKDLISGRFWNTDARKNGDIVYERIKDRFDFDEEGYFIHFYFSEGRDGACFSEPYGIFDAFGNGLAVLTGIATSEQAEKIRKFALKIARNKYPMLPAHYPFIHESIFRSRELHQYRFKEFLGEYHNGGLWPWYMGVYTSALVKTGNMQGARRCLDGILSANAETKDGMRFYEYHTSRQATADLTVRKPGGLDEDFRAAIDNILRTQKPAIQGRKQDITVDITFDRVRPAFALNKGDRITVIVVGPDSEDVLSTIASITDENGERYFEDVSMTSVPSTPSGTPSMGVSAAAYIIGYNAVTKGTVLFSDGEA
jgi:hypothetical protein